MVGATSRPDMLDAALLRPGRLDRLLYCGFPTARERLQVRGRPGHHAASVRTPCQKALQSWTPGCRPSEGSSRGACCAVRALSHPSVEHAMGRASYAHNICTKISA